MKIVNRTNREARWDPRRGVLSITSARGEVLEFVVLGSPEVVTITRELDDDGDEYFAVASPSQPDQQQENREITP